MEEFFVVVLALVSLALACVTSWVKLSRLESESTALARRVAQLDHDLSSSLRQLRSETPLSGNASSPYSGCQPETVAPPYYGLLQETDPELYEELMADRMREDGLGPLS